jgi:hypothetical protein
MAVEVDGLCGAAHHPRSRTSAPGFQRNCRRSLPARSPRNDEISKLYYFEMLKMRNW